ncbi:MAG: T9SS type A sorting domain-containing protein [Bacteroidia bacterium]|nr:T9SS type A sorting domain-containing protein [Bacteroidia bacterium]
MKKNLLIAASLMASVIAKSQTPFFDLTTYRGAFAPAPTPMWTQGWTEWDPQNKVYPAPNVTVSGNITSSTTWSTGQVVLLQGPVYVKNNAVLTIQPGVVVLGSKSANGSALIVTRGSQLIANGTSVNPIVFTSDQPPGARALGDWGGVILLGQAPLNYTNGVNYIEGLPQNPDSQYGGGANPNPNDNSGSLKYVRIEFGGYVYQPNQEINGLTFGAVGAATQVDYVQVSFTNDDGFEWFGGNVSAKHLVSYRNLDDDFDTDNGWSGFVQYALAVRDPQIADNPSVSTSEGFESDNDANGTSATPKTQGIFSNVTIIGPYRGIPTATVASGYRRALRLRRNTELKVFNSLFMDTDRGIHIDGSATETNAANGTLKFKNNIIAGTKNGRITEKNTGSTFTITAWFAANNNDSIVYSSPSFSNLLITPYNYTAPDYRPASGSAALSGASFTDAAIAPYTNTATAIVDISSENINVMAYPNPASDVVTFISGNDKPYTVNILDLTGKAIISKEIRDNEPVNISNLVNGIYFVRINDKTIKIVVQH